MQFNQCGLTVSHQRVLLVCLLWACGYPPGESLSHGSGGGFKVLKALLVYGFSLARGASNNLTVGFEKFVQL